MSALRLNPPVKEVVWGGRWLAEELGRKVVLNIVMVGFFGAVTNLLDPDSLRKAVEDSVPPAMARIPCGWKSARPPA